jgi:hypothetical protein
MIVHDHDAFRVGRIAFWVLIDRSGGFHFSCSHVPVGRLGKR